MKLKLKFHRVPDTAKNRQALEQELKALPLAEELKQAEVLVEQPSEGTSEIALRLNVEAPGAKLKAEARDYTFAAVLRKAMEVLRRKLRERNHRRSLKQDSVRRTWQSRAARA